MDPRQADEQNVKAVREEGEKDEPEGPVVQFALHLVGKAALVEVGDGLGEVVELDLGGKEDEDQTAAETWSDQKG